MARYIAIISFAVSFLCAACAEPDFFSHDEFRDVSISLPKTEDYKIIYSEGSIETSQMSGWHVLYISGSDTGSKDVPAGTRTVTFKLPKDIPASILAEPVYKKSMNNRNIHPAGCIYPYSENATWQDGFASSILYSLYAGAADSDEAVHFSECFNWQRFIKEIRQRFSNTAYNDVKYNPWQLDKDDILSSIVQNKFTVRKLNQKAVNQ